LAHSALQVDNLGFAIFTKDSTSVVGHDLSHELDELWRKTIEGQGGLHKPVFDRVECLLEVDESYVKLLSSGLRIFCHILEDANVFENRASWSEAVLLLQENIVGLAVRTEPAFNDASEDLQEDWQQCDAATVVRVRARA
jgi:hypothetical protein